MSSRIDIESDALGVELPIRAALHYLERASDDWRNRDPRAGGPLHWPVAIAEARRALCAALVALGEPQSLEAYRAAVNERRAAQVRP